jgi:hypothetical protein
VVGFPCNQFGGQEPGSSEEIAEFCSATYGVTFPMFEKIEVNGAGRHPIYDVLTAVPDTDGEAGDIMWNFEKFLVRPDGTVAARFRPRTVPDDPAVLAAIEASLPGLIPLSRLAARGPLLRGWIRGWTCPTGPVPRSSTSSACPLNDRGSKTTL